MKRKVKYSTVGVNEKRMSQLQIQGVHSICLRFTAVDAGDEAAEGSGSSGGGGRLRG